MLKLQTRLILIILFLLPTYLIKIKFGWVSFNTLEVLIGLLFIVWAFNKEKKYPATAGPRRGGGFILLTRYFMPILLILTGLLLSVIANKNYYIGLGAIKGWFVFPIIFGIMFYDALKKDESLLGKSLLALFFSGAMVSAIGAIYKLSGLLTYDGRLRIFYDSPNQLGMFLAPIFIVGLMLLARENKHWRKLLFLAGLFLLAINLYFTYSYGTWVALLIALLVAFWLKYRTFGHRVGLLILILLSAIIISQAKSQKLEDLKNLGGRSSLDSRIMIWRSAGLMIENNPLFGIGPGNFQNKYLEYQKYFPPYLEWAVPQPHNIFLAFWLESGLLGLIGFVWLLILFFHDNKKVYPFTKINKKNNNSIHEIKKQTGNSLNDKEYFGGGAIENNRLYGILCLAIMLYFIIHGLVDITYWRNDLAVLFWIIININMFLSMKKTT